MSRPTIIVVLGADRVGKSTIVSNTHEQFKEADIDSTVLHFSGPKPHHDSPIEQYIVPFEGVLDTYPQVVICDRGFGEVCFYDKFRRHVDISEEWALASESYFSSRASKIYVFLIKRPWEWSKPHHIIEIKEQNPDSSSYFVHNQLLMRKAEHYAYYEYMEDYLKNRSLLPHTVFNLTDNTSPDLFRYVGAV